MRRREFLIRSASGLGVAWLSSNSILNAIADQTLPAKFSASDTVTLGSTGIKTSRLAMGTGTVGSGNHSHQTALGVKGLSDLLLNGYDHGLRFFDSADSYGSHPHVAEALKHVQRDKVTVLTKSWARDAAGMRTARQSHAPYENMGARSRHCSRRSRPLPPRTRHRLSRRLPDALRHRG